MTVSASNQAAQYYRSLIESQAQSANFQKMQELARETKDRVKEATRVDAPQARPPQPAPEPKATTPPAPEPQRAKSITTTPPPKPAPDIRQVVNETDRKESAKAQAEAADNSRALAESAARSMERNRDARQRAEAMRQRFAAAA